MAPRTRTTKPSPGRSTRNSIFGRPPLPPPKPRNSSTDKSPVRTAPTRDTEIEGRVTSNVSNTGGTPWLACRDVYGVMTTIAVSETGEGIHVRWYYPDDDCEVDEDEEAEVEMTVYEERGVTPCTTAGPNNAVRRPFPQTPIAPQPYDAGSVIQTPVKKARPLQRSPPRIGDKGIRCLYEKGGVLRELNGGARIVLRHPVGSTANLSREQVECLEKEREDRIVQVQVEKLLADKQRLDDEEKHFSDSGYEDEMETDSLEEIDGVSGFLRGPNGELLDRHGRQMLGREGTILIDPAHEEAFMVLTEVVDHSRLNSCASEAKGLRRARFGPEGTELID